MYLLHKEKREIWNQRQKGTSIKNWGLEIIIVQFEFY